MKHYNGTEKKSWNLIISCINFASSLHLRVRLYFILFFIVIFFLKKKKKTIYAFEKYGLSSKQVIELWKRIDLIIAMYFP